MRVGTLEIQMMASMARLSKDMNDAQRVVGGAMGGIEKSVASAKRAMQMLGVGLPLVEIADQVRRMTDQYTKLDAQLRLATKSQAQYAQGMTDLRRISSVVQSDISATSQLYTRLMQVTEGMGISQSKIATVTETVAYGLKAYGATAQEAASASLQLSQAMGANRLGGEEFRAVMEAMPNVMKVLAASMGVPLGELRALSIAGKITTEQMIKAFGDPAIAAQFKAMAEGTQTISGAWIVARNELSLLIGEFMKSSGGVNIFIGAFKAMGETFRIMSQYMSEIISLSTTMSILYAGKYLMAMQAAWTITRAHTEALAMDAAGEKARAAVIAQAKAAEVVGSNAAAAAKLRETIAAREAVFAAESELVAKAASARATIAQTETILASTNMFVSNTAAKEANLVATAELAAAETALAKINNARTAAQAEAMAMDAARTRELRAQTIAIEASVAAEEARIVATTGGISKLKGFLQGAVSMVGGKLGLIGFALWGAYEIADHTGFIDRIFATTEEKIKKLRTEIINSREAIPQMVGAKPGGMGNFNVVPGLAEDTAKVYLKSVGDLGDLDKKLGILVGGTFKFNEKFLTDAQEKAAKLKDIMTTYYAELDKLQQTKGLSNKDRSDAAIAIHTAMVERMKDIDKKYAEKTKEDLTLNRMRDLRIDMEAKLESEGKTLTNVERITRDFLKAQEANGAASADAINQYELAQKAAVLQDEEDMRKVYHDKAVKAMEEADKVNAELTKERMAREKAANDAFLAQYKEVLSSVEAPFKQAFSDILLQSGHAWTKMRDSFKKIFVDYIYQVFAQRFVIQTIAAPIAGMMMPGLAGAATMGAAGGALAGAGAGVVVAGGSTVALGTEAAIGAHGMAGMVGSTPIMAGGVAAGMSPLAIAAMAAPVALFVLDKLTASSWVGESKLVGMASRAGFAGTRQQEWSQSSLFGGSQSGTTITQLTVAENKKLNDGLMVLQKTMDSLGGAIGSASIATNEWSVSINQAGDISNTVAAAMLGNLAPAIKALGKEGETLEATAKRITEVFTTTDAAFSSLGLSLSSIGLASMSARDGLISAAGGVQNFNSLWGTFSSSILTGSDKLKPSLDIVGKTFSELGITGVTTNKQFSDLVSEQIRLGKTDVVVKLLGISSAFADITKTAGTATETLLGLATRTMGVNAGFTGTANAAVGTSASLAEARANYERIAAQAYNAGGFDVGDLRGRAATQAAQKAASDWTTQHNTELENAAIVLENATRANKNATVASNDATSASNTLTSSYYSEVDALLAAIPAVDGVTTSIQSVADAAAAAQRIAQERYGLETQLLQAQGNTAELRARELVLLDASNRPLQEQIWALQDKAVADAAAAKAADEAAKAQQQAIDDAMKAAQQLKDAWQSVTNSIFEEVARIRGILGSQNTAYSESQFAIATAQARAGNQDAAKLLPALSRAVLEVAASTATNALDLSRTRARIAGSLEQTGMGLASTYGLSLPSFAVGTNEVPQDMIAQIHAGETIIPKPYVDKQQETNSINADMRAELTAIRIELVNIKNTNYKMWQIEDKWDIEGTPEVREAA